VLKSSSFDPLIPCISTFKSKVVAKSIFFIVSFVISTGSFLVLLWTFKNNHIIYILHVLVLSKIYRLAYFVYKYNLICSLGQLSVAWIHRFFVMLSLDSHVTITNNTVKPKKTVFVVLNFCFICVFKFGESSEVPRTKKIYIVLYHDEVYWK